MTLERCAEMRAEMDSGQLRIDVLARAGVSVDEWVVSQGAWLDEMGTDLARGRFELTDRYTLAFLDRQRALKAATPSLAVAVAVEAEAEARPARPPETMPPTQDSPTLPLTPWRGPAALPALPFTPTPSSPTARADSVASTPAAAPFFPATWPQRKPVDAAEPETAPIPPLRAAPVEAASAEAAEPAWASSTSWLQPSPIPRESLPFRPAAPAIKPPPPPVVPVAAAAIHPSPADAGASADRSEWETSTTGMAPSVLRPALPFQPAPPATASTPISQPTSLGSTTSSMQSPFASPPAAPPPRRAPPPPPMAARPVRATPPPLPSKRVPAATPSQPASPAPAAKATSAAVDGGLSLEQHASLCVEIALDPSRAAEALGRYRVTAARKAELDLLWKTRFSADPALELRWKEAYRLYSDFLAKRRS